jgi:hypothetical protein
MGKSKFQPWLGRSAATGVFCSGYVENKEVSLAPQVGFEPSTLRLAADSAVGLGPFILENSVRPLFGIIRPISAGILALPEFSCF